MVKLINLIRDSERFKRLCSDFGLATEKKRLQQDPCENKDTYRKDITCSHAMLTLLTLSI